ncbi:MAG: HAMP domain-containing histidine kinase [Firmicutes bacterium]|nr:HAMP domain-containing histidine kinase [Bacillota bacterium]
MAKKNFIYERISKRIASEERSKAQREAEKMRQEFTANVSHELKTPLQSISGYAELLKSGMVKEEDVQQFAERIYSESQRMITLVNDILELSHLDEGMEDMIREDVDLYEVATKAVDSLEEEAASAGVALELTGESSVINGYSQLLSLIIYNLCENGIKYNNPRGSVKVDINDFRDHAVLTVNDNGIGIPLDQQERVFERFYRVDKSHSKEVGGTGLGLSIVKHATAIHNGEIHLVSAPKYGTTITITFPKGADN